jgi:AraC-like DNA-binding protein
VLQGEEHYNIDGRLRRVRAGEFILVEAGTDSDARIPTPSETIGLCIYLPSTPHGLVEADIGSPVIFGGGGDPFAEALNHFAHQAVGGANVDSTRIARAAARGAEEFLARFHERRERLSHTRPAARTEVLHRLERARALIHANAHRTVTLEEICREAALSRFHLTRMFSEVYGAPPLSYHRQLRLDLAAIRLQHEVTSPTALARELGYGSLSAFSRAFRSRFGFPPSGQRNR